MDEILKEQTNGVMEFLSTKEGQAFNFGSLYPRLISGNDEFFKKKTKRTIDELYGYFKKEEMLFLAKVFRHAFEYAANIEQKKYPIPQNIKIEKTNAGGVPAEWQTTPNAIKDHVLLYLHGGGMVLGSPNSHRVFTTTLGQLTKMRVLSVDYRLAPEHPYPAQLEDCFTAYKWLLSTGVKPKNIVIAGDSAGGGLALSTLVKSRNDEVPLPAGAVCLSPVTEWSGSSDTFWKNAETDPVLAEVGIFWWIPAFLGGADPTDPLVSPLFADLKGLPPILVQASTCEMLYGGAKSFVEKAKEAGVKAILQTWNAMPHVFQSFGLHDLPKAKEAVNKIVEFIQKLFK